MTISEARLGTARSHIPLDALLAVLYAIAIAALVVVSPAGFEGPVRVLLALPLLLFAPGYALLAVLYPGRRRTPDAAPTRTRETGVPNHEGITWGERAAISFAASLALIPLLAVLLSVARVPLTPTPIALTLAAVTVLGAVVGALRRLQLPAGQRLRLPTSRWSEELRSATVGAPTRREAVLNTTLLLVAILALSGLAYGLVAPPSGAGYTEAALLTENGSELVAGNYTTEFATGESAPLVLTVENQEGTQRTYTALVALERVRGSGDDFAVVERVELTRFSMTVDDGQTARETHEIQPSLRGEDLRLSYYIYAGDAPERPSDGPPEKHLYLWVDVGQGTEDDSADVDDPDVPADVDPAHVPADAGSADAPADGSTALHTSPFDGAA